jgi:GMP synthase-like glutamine amidotransferase
MSAMPLSTAGRRITVLQQVPFEGPGGIVSWAAARGHALRRVTLHDGEPVPGADGVDALIVMGGPMGVGDEDHFAFLRGEKQLIRACVDGGRPVLGICLGAQLLAEALGARVSAQGFREIGWLPLRWAVGARAVPGLAHVPDESVVFHWHGDTFELPPGTLLLASSAACPNQGFATPDGRAVGLQFHIEMRDEDVRAIVAHGRDELVCGGSFVQAEDALLDGSGRHAAPLRPLLEAFLDGWSASVKRRADGT